MKIAFIGLGEAASAIISGWGPARASEIAAYDIKTEDPTRSGAIGARAERLGITLCQTRQAALRGAELVFSTVTANQAVHAADQCATSLDANAIWLDLNSCAPGSKQQAADTITKAGAGYLDVAVMAPVHPKKNLVPMLLSGPDAHRTASVLATLPLSVRVVGDTIGRASTIKLVRSIMVKGLEALTAECALAAIATGTQNEVFPSLNDGHPKIDIASRAAYNLERATTHGIRRSEEMAEAARMLTDLGLPNAMSAASVEWQARLGTLTDQMSETDGLEDMARRILKSLR